MNRRENRILVVEDDPSSRKLIRAVLRASGAAIESADDLAAARGRLASEIPDLILLDLRLHDGDGLELAREVRADPRLQRVPIVAVTAQALKGDRERALAAGCDHYLPKPIDTRELRRIVDALLGGGR